MESKLTDFYKILQRENLDGIFLVSAPNIRYLSGYTGVDSYAVISPEGNVFITDYRYIEQAQKECKGYDVLLHHSPDRKMTDILRDYCYGKGIKRLAFEKKYVSFELYETLQEKIGDTAELIPAARLVEELRAVKDSREQGYLKRACAITDRTFEGILGIIEPGMTEKEIALEIQYLLGISGADDRAFDIIVAAGKNGSLPHAIPSECSVQEGDLITMDFGALYKGFHADMTRTIVIGRPSEKQRDVYNTVKKAQGAALAEVKAGVSVKSLDGISTDIIAAAGYEEHMGRGLGHGIGLMIHEEPFVSSNRDSVLEAGNVITIEPGIYIPGWGGVRIEDSVIVKEDGYEVITNSTKELVIL